MRRERHAYQRHCDQMTNRVIGTREFDLHRHRRLPPPPLLERELLRLLCPRVLAARSDFPLE